MMDNYLGYPQQQQYGTNIGSAPPPPYNPNVPNYQAQPVLQPPVVFQCNHPQTTDQRHDIGVKQSESTHPNFSRQNRDKINQVRDIVDFEPVVVGPCLWILVIIAIFCCCILGFIALIVAIIACSKEYAGRIAVAVRYAKAARILSILSIVLGFVIICINILLRFSIPQDFSRYGWDNWNQKD